VSRSHGTELGVFDGAGTSSGGPLKTRQLGSLEVSVVGLGTNNFGTDFFGKSCNLHEATRIISAALDAGVNFLDTAEEYSTRSRNGTGQSEQFIGQALQKLGTRRDELVIATKFLNEDLAAPGEHGPKRIIRALEGSLRRLNVERVDLYQQHRPDPDTPLDDTLGALDTLIHQGKVREIGCSNFTGAQIDAAQQVSAWHGLPAFVTSQSRYNLLEGPREEGALEGCIRNSLMLLPYYPLASGLLTGKFGRDGVPPAGSRLAEHTTISDRLKGSLLTPDRLVQVGELETFAKENGHTLLELSMSWLTSQPFVGSVITGATSPEQIVANARGASWELSEEDLRRVAQITAPAGR
jgi:aryl-alcohol dehydrogenase-like predicted oxidoreductase